MAQIQYRRFDQHSEDPEKVYSLFDTVYKNSTAICKRWTWEFLSHPESENIKIYVAESLGKLHGMTVRMPGTLMMGGKTKRAYFATNSMTSPESRGRGIIRELYGLAAQDGDIQLSKGTAPAMYDVLQKIGYREIIPNTYQVCLLAPHKWALSKMFRKVRFTTREVSSDMQLGEFYRLSCFSGEEEALANAICPGSAGGIVKSLPVLNWRYFEIPHRRYHVFVRKFGNETVSMIVLRLEGLTAYLVDFLWTARAQDEPKTSIRFAKSLALKMGAVKLVFWGSYERLRDEMRKQLFFERNDSPRFSFYSTDVDCQSIVWGGLHFVHGDGDTEYL